MSVISQYSKCAICRERATREWQGALYCAHHYTVVKQKPAVTYVQIPADYSKGDPNY